MMSGEYIVREARREDMVTIVRMIAELAAFEGYPNGSKLTAEDLERDGFTVQPPRFLCLVAERAPPGPGVPPGLGGYLLGNYAYSSWVGRALYVEDFYVKPELRGTKLGHRLFKQFCIMGRDNGCKVMDWHCLDKNETAIRFYKAHGAQDICKDEGRTCLRILKDEILTVANSDD